jgi:hypothetical protein
LLSYISSSCEVGVSVWYIDMPVYTMRTFLLQMLLIGLPGNLLTVETEEWRRTDERVGIQKYTEPRHYAIISFSSYCQSGIHCPQICRQVTNL